MECVTGFAANVGSNVLGGLCKKVVQVIKMVRDLPTAVRDMNVQVQRLKDVRDDIDAALGREQRPAKNIVQNWLKRVGRAIESSESISNDYEQRKDCLMGCCPNCLCRYRISKHINALNATVDQLQDEKRSDFPTSEDYVDRTPSDQIPIQHSIFDGNGITIAQSKVERWLIEDTNIRVIGVYGMGGVGKTSLLQTINNSQKVRESFAPIIWLTVSRDYDILNLQDCIAGKLELELPDRFNLEGRKHKLFTYFKNKKFLLILDDMWRSEDLQSLGVPLMETASKIVLSTRSRVVCNQMKANEILRVEPLSGEEGWQLFCKGAFLNGNVPHELEDVARKIAAECQGLPLAINVVAAGMRNYSDQEREWEHALHQMQNVDETFYVIHDEIEKELFQRLKWSYNALPEDLKTCFLYLAAYPEDNIISCREVIDIWIAEGVVKGGPESYLPDTAGTFINFLRDRCLIEVVRTDVVGRISSVKMHDILRDLAIRIAEKEHGCYFKAGQGVSHFPVDQEVDRKGCARISLVYNRLDSLPTTSAFSFLSVLLLRENSGIKEVPGSFLRGLPSLKVLDLSSTNITSLPPSIGDLKHLASLQLQRTKISKLPETIGHLCNLQFLDLEFCRELRCLPKRISELKRLRVLIITYCSKLTQLPRGISELVSLERLEMLSSISMDFEEDGNGERKHACLRNLQSLRQLRVFSVTMTSPVKEGVIGNWSKMRALTLWFDGVNQDYLPQDMQAMKDLESLYLGRCWDMELLPSWVSEFQRLVYLHLESCHELKELPTELPCLRELWIEQCHQLQQLELGMGIPKLEKLILGYLRSLECVRAVAASGSEGLGEGASPLPNLRTLRVIGCDKLKTLRGEWDKLKCLEEIRGDREWWDAIQWEDPNMRTLLESKCRLR